jgi:hypothetical protein
MHWPAAGSTGRGCAGDGAAGGFFPSRQHPYSSVICWRGLARPYQNGDFHPGGLDIDGASQLLDRQGQVSPRLWALGFPSRRALLHPCFAEAGLVSRVVLDAERCVLAMAQQLLPQHQYGAVCNAG